MSADRVPLALRVLGWVALIVTATLVQAAVTYWGYDSLTQLSLHVWAWAVFVVGTAGAVLVCYGLCWLAATHQDHS